MAIIVTTATRVTSARFDGRINNSNHDGYNGQDNYVCTKSASMAALLAKMATTAIV